MAAASLFERVKTIDVRLIAAAAAAVLLIVGVMWTIPSTPESNEFKFDSARRTLSNAKPMEINHAVSGQIVDGSDVDFYRISSGGGGPLHVHVSTDAGNLLPALDIYDADKKLIQEKLGPDDTFVAHPNATYYIQVAGQRSTTGKYTLECSFANPQ